MKRILRYTTLAGAISAAVWLTFLAPVAEHEANADVVFGIGGGGVYYGGGYAPQHRGYSGYGYSPYGGGAYTYVAPRAYVYPSYRSHGYGSAYGVGPIYNGGMNYGNSGYYRQTYRQSYTPYGHGGYGYGGYGTYGY